MPLKVIGAGMGRTGTTSLKLALEQLGFGPCCHMVDLISTHRDRSALWERAFGDEAVDWEEIFKGFNSAVDAPTNFYYRELAEAYPEAKVILTVRDPEARFRSIAATFLSPEFRAREETPDPARAKMQAKVEAAQIKRGFRPAGGYPTDPTEAARVGIAQFMAWNDQVKRTIAPERLLVYDVKEGWEPLCKFLGVPTPQTPFPHENTAQAFVNRVNESAARPR